jgi:leucyl-tRNA synthetase
VTRSQAQRLLAALSPFAPHIAEELWHRLGADGLCAAQAWPKPDMRYAVDDEIDLPVQVNGKLRATPKAPKDADKAGLEAVARAAVAAHLEGKEILKVVIVPGRLVNFVIKG